MNIFEEREKINGYLILVTALEIVENVPFTTGIRL